MSRLRRQKNEVNTQQIKSSTPILGDIRSNLEEVRHDEIRETLFFAMLQQATQSYFENHAILVVVVDRPNRNYMKYGQLSAES